MEDTILHLSSFINSFANILLELKEVEDSYIDHLETILGTFFVIFPQLYSVQRDKYYLAVSRLLVSLYSKVSALRTLLNRVGMYIYIDFFLFQRCTNENSIPGINSYMFQISWNCG